MLKYIGAHKGSTYSITRNYLFFFIHGSIQLYEVGWDIKFSACAWLCVADQDWLRAETTYPITEIKYYSIRT